MLLKILLFTDNPNFMETSETLKFSLEKLEVIILGSSLKTYHIWQYLIFGSSLKTYCMYNTFSIQSFSNARNYFSILNDSNDTNSFVLKADQKEN